MSDPIVKGVKRSPSRPASRQTSSTPSARGRALANKSARPKPIVKRKPAEKAPARKATKSNTTAASKTKASSKTSKSAPARKPATNRSQSAASSKKTAAKALARKPQPAKKSVAPAKSRKIEPPRSRAAQSKATTKTQPARKHVAPPTPPRQPTRDEAAALKAFEHAHKEFVRGRFAEARNLFRALVEKHTGVSEVTARARTYLAIAEARLRTESSLPRDADSLYDRGVIELNRGEYVAAQEMFERAIKREPEAAHVHYGLAAARARLGAIDSALQSLQRALEIQPNLRVRAQHDLDMAVLRNDPEFERLVFAPRS